MSTLIYASPDNTRANRNRREPLDLYDFLDMYCPIDSNSLLPKGTVSEEIICKVFDRREYKDIAHYVGNRQLWTLSKIDNKFIITTGPKIRDTQDLIGYLVTEIPFNRNDMGTLRVEFD